MKVVRLALVDPKDSSRASLKNLLLGIDAVWLEAECSSYDYFLDVVTQTQPDIALIAIDSDPTKGLDLIAQISGQLPGCAALVISGSQEGSLILRAMRNGAREYLSLPLRLEDFLSALDRIQQTTHSRTDEGRAKSAQVITVAGVCGGVGCTAIAINLACMFAQNPSNNVAVIDLDLALGDADVWLDIIPDYTIQDVADNISRLDYSLLKRSLTKHSSGAYLLPRPVQMDERPAISPDELRRVISLLKATFTHLILDISKSFSALDIAAMECSDSVLLISQLDLPCLRNVVRLMQFFDQRPGLPEKIKILVNRIGLQDANISLNKALETIGREIYSQLPNDYVSMVESRNNGVPLLLHAPKSRITKAIEQLVQQLDPPLEDDEKKPAEPVKAKKGLFSFLSGASR
ncbi:MAG: AAA family ATPase [Planctomycetaceae bacterium]|nr:AAA family ATPase [Planctomycetaceae bacterium]